MLKSKEFEIRKLLFRLYIYNRYKYKLSNSDHYALLDFISTKGGYKIKHIDRIFKETIKDNLTIQSFCRNAKVYEIRYNLSREQLLDKFLTNN